MDNNETYDVTPGAALQIDVTLRDSLGAPITGYSGSETMSTTVWPGGNRAASFTATTTWDTPADATITITLAATQTATLKPGRYQLLTRLTPGAGQPVDAYGCNLDVLPVAGSDAAPTSYTTYADLLRFGRRWLRQLQTADDEAGFAEQQHRARTWIEDLAHAHYRVASMAMVVGSQAFGPRRSGSRSVYLQEQLDADTLMITDQVVEAAAKKALAYICEGQLDGDPGNRYGRLARMYHGQADYLGMCLVLQLDTDADGFSDITIDCSCTDPMYG
jgi:hypothetical protein